MATKRVVVSKRERTRFSDEFRKRALLRAVSEGVPETARSLGLQPAQLYARRAKAQHTGRNEESPASAAL
jgi:transposase